MLERVIENWLIKASEKSIQVPFCYMLTKKGINVLLLTRHWSMEKGKDIIARDSDNNIYAYQLKSANNGRITMGQWQDINRQLFDLVTLDVDHVSVNSANKKYHRSFLVTNGYIDEDVSTAINDLNRGFEKGGRPECKLEVFSRGDLFEMAKELGSDLWPSELIDVRTFLEMHLEDGKGLLPKEKLCNLFESSFKLSADDQLSNAECQRVISAAALICSLSINSFTNRSNYVAEIEAWVLYISYVYCLVEKYSLPEKHWKNSVDIAKMQISALLENLVNELKGRTNYIEGDFPTDIIFYKERITKLISLLSIYGLMEKHGQVQITEDIKSFIEKFIKDKMKLIIVWGEAAIPQFMAFYWFYRKLDATQRSVAFLASIIRAFLKRNKNNSSNPYPNPYYDIEQLFSSNLGMAEDLVDEKFDGYSYMLEGLFYIYVKHNYKNRCKMMWSEYSKIKSIYFDFDTIKDFYRWKNNNGNTKIKDQKREKKWQELKNEAFECRDEWIPLLIKNDPIFLLLLMIVIPHRFDSRIARWLDTRIDG